MCVKFATQILSESVGKVLEQSGNMETLETAKYCKMFDSFFDCLNVRSLTENERKRKPFLAPFTSENDERFVCLQKELLKYFIDWKQSIVERPGNFTQNAMAKIFISWQTFEGLCITIYSIVSAIKELLSRGVKYVFSEPFCQDLWRSTLGIKGNLVENVITLILYNLGTTTTPYVVRSKCFVLLVSCRYNKKRSWENITDEPVPKPEKVIVRTELITLLINI